MKFTWRINRTQFRYHSYPESSETHCAKNRGFRQTLSPGDCVALFDTIGDLNESITLTKQLSKLCHTIVAKMPQYTLFFDRVTP